ncbi:MAG: 3-methylcrotonyl-CoA carboxylase [Legionellales bacterium RIFCSPHIGHO2_12_FULL_35_11]|nr:MAG: 3-methylcrotonyl-CoA carboxylase [Legionellales bacterium RIFCSPHIGHO2_12_FULL_35_11]
MLQKILIANRGEIACRIIKTAKKMGIKTVAVYSKADVNSLHVSQADQAFCIGESEAIKSYLDINKIVNIAKIAGADAVHPGYGFLSESAAFAEELKNNNIIFIGPSVDAMQAMASKQTAKQILEKTNVPLTPGFHGKEQSDDVLLKEAQKIGFPILIKAASGGGGKGMRSVTKLDDFAIALAGARREAKASFDDDTMLIEKLIAEPKHIEMQIIADNFGNVLHLFERDCSIQRRHQKIIEEAPAFGLPEKLKHNLAKAAVEVAKTINYRGAGTIEFLVDKQHNFYFMEMNTRLQVEHPVTEMITGLDLVELQILVASGEKLPLSQDQITEQGHAIECRLYAEDPTNNFMPSIGKISYLQSSDREEGIRIDTGIISGSEVSRYYDPMLAKIIAHGQTREQARLRLLKFLENYRIAGVKNNLAFLHSILTNASYVENKITTHFLSDEQISPDDPNLVNIAFFAAAIDFIYQYYNRDPVTQSANSFQLHINSHWIRKYLITGHEFIVAISPLSNNQLEIKLQNSGSDEKIIANFYVNTQLEQLIVKTETCTQTIFFHKNTTATTIFNKLTAVEVLPCIHQSNLSNNNANNQLTAPMPGTVVAILKKSKDEIKIGEPLIVLEAMKMEYTITAPSDGVISSIFCDIGSQVTEGATLVALEKL